MKYVINSQEHPIGKVKDFIYRVEFKIRGTVGTPYNTAPYITGSNIARLGHGSQNSWSKLWIPVVKSAPVRVIFVWKSVSKKRIHGSSDIYIWEHNGSRGTTPRGLTV